MKIKLDKGAYEPIRAHDTDAGLDLKSPIELRIPAHGHGVIDTGVHVKLPEGCAGVIMSKSGLNVKHNITSTGLIDQGYEGSIVVKLYNHGDEDYVVHEEDKITQLVVTPVRYEPVELVEEMDSVSERGDNGFGSTGR